MLSIDGSWRCRIRRLGALAEVLVAGRPPSAWLARAASDHPALQNLNWRHRNAADCTHDKMLSSTAVQMLLRTDALLACGRLQKLRATERSPELRCWLVRPCGRRRAILHLC